MNKAAKAAIKELRELPLEQQRLESLKRESKKTVEDQRLEAAIADQLEKIALIENTLAILSPTEQRILKSSYIRKTESIADIMISTNYSDAQINRIKYIALKKYAYARGFDI